MRSDHFGNNVTLSGREWRGKSKITHAAKQSRNWTNLNQSPGEPAQLSWAADVAPRTKAERASEEEHRA
jgi:hypothetical protein